MLKNIGSLLLITLVFALPTQLLSQQAQQTKTKQMNMPCYDCKHHGYMKKDMYINPVTDEEVKKIVNNYITNNNLKGYSIVSIKRFVTTRGPRYFATLKDSSNNLFTLMIPFAGVVKGPFPTTEIK
ncbi:MAG: hypothetical protein SVN78_10455 [Deferribacterota bacterium]|nr:hypothetical protein [Deferribacterota bacterium]